MTVTIMDVAELAGVSYQTVSRLLNHPEAVAEATASRVRAAIEELRWTPSSAARILQAGRMRPEAQQTVSMESDGPK